MRDDLTDIYRSIDYLNGLPGYCAQRVLRDPTVWLGVFGGGFLTAFLMIYRIRGSIVIGVFLVAIISWPRNTAVTYFPHTEAGDDLFAFFKEVVTFRPLQKVGVAIDVSRLHPALLFLSFMLNVEISGRATGRDVSGTP